MHLYLSRSFVEFGPVTFFEAHDQFKRGILHPSDFARLEHTSDWMPLPDALARMKNLPANLFEVFFLQNIAGRTERNLTKADVCQALEELAYSEQRAFYQRFFKDAKMLAEWRLPTPTDQQIHQAILAASHARPGWHFLEGGPFLEMLSEILKFHQNSTAQTEDSAPVSPVERVEQKKSKSADPASGQSAKRRRQTSVSESQVAKKKASAAKKMAAQIPRKSGRSRKSEPSS